MEGYTEASERTEGRLQNAGPMQILEMVLLSRILKPV